MKLVRLHLDDTGAAPWEAEVLIGLPSVRGTRFALVSVRVEIPGPEPMNCPGVPDLVDLPGPGEACSRCGAPAGEIGVIQVTKPPQVHLRYQVLPGAGTAGEAHSSYSLDEVEFAGGFSVTLTSPLAVVDPEEG